MNDITKAGVITPVEMAEKLKVRLAIDPVEGRIGQIMGELDARYTALYGSRCKLREVIVLCQAAAVAISLPALTEQGYSAKTSEPEWLEAAALEVERLDANVARMINFAEDKFKY